MASVVLTVLSSTLVACIFLFISTLLQAIEYIFSHLLLDYSFLALILTGRSVETHKGRFGRSASLSQLTIEDTAHVRRTMTEHMDRTVAILRTLPKEMLLVFRLVVKYKVWAAFEHVFCASFSILPSFLLTPTQLLLSAPPPLPLSLPPPRRSSNRNINLVRSIVRAHGTPVNRFNIMARR